MRYDASVRFFTREGQQATRFDSGSTVKEAVRKVLRHVPKGRAVDDVRVRRRDDHVCVIGVQHDGLAAYLDGDAVVRGMKTREEFQEKLSKILPKYVIVMSTSLNNPESFTHHQDAVELAEWVREQTW